MCEEQFKPIITDNYYNCNHFWFELDHTQTSHLMSLSASLVLSPTTSVIPQNATKWKTIFQARSLPESREEVEGCSSLASEIDCSNISSANSDSTHVAAFSEVDSQSLKDQLNVIVVEQEEEQLVLKKPQELALKSKSQDLSLRGCTKESAAVNGTQSEEKGFAEKQMGFAEKNDENPCTSSDFQSIIAQLVQGMEELNAFKTEQTLKMGYLEQKLVEAEEQIQLLKNRCDMLASKFKPSKEHIDEAANNFDELHLDPTDGIYLMGGYDGESWLSAFNLYSPSEDVVKSLRPMISVRSCGSVAQLSDELYVFGGGNGQLWYDTANDQWTPRPSLTAKRGSLAAATLNDKIFAIGGGNGLECFADVEMLDLDIGRWIPTRSMLQKRFALAAVELNGVLYATGGFDGNDYLKSAERFDPREHSWSRIASMNSKRGCPSFVVLNEKLYAMGGFDGSSMVPSTEIFDPRLGSWIIGEPMNQPRGYSTAAVVKEFIYVIGGLKSNESIIDTVECFKEGKGWQEKKSKAIKKRCFLSAVAL